MLTETLANEGEEPATLAEALADNLNITGQEAFLRQSEGAGGLAARSGLPAPIYTIAGQGRFRVKGS